MGLKKQSHLQLAMTWGWWGCYKGRSLLEGLPLPDSWLAQRALLCHLSPSPTHLACWPRVLASCRQSSPSCLPWLFSPSLGVSLLVHGRTLIRLRISSPELGPRWDTRQPLPALLLSSQGPFWQLFQQKGPKFVSLQNWDFAFAETLHSSQHNHFQYYRHDIYYFRKKAASFLPEGKRNRITVLLIERISAQLSNLPFSPSGCVTILSQSWPHPVQRLEIKHEREATC